jgi:hypothetical protein
MPPGSSYPTPISPTAPHPQFRNTEQIPSAVPEESFSSFLVKVEETNGSQSIASPSHIPPAPSLTLTTEDKERIDGRAESEIRRDHKRRRIDPTVSTEQIPGDGNGGHSTDATEGVVDISSADLPAWRVKVEGTQAEGELDKPMEEEGDNIDELRDEEYREERRIIQDHPHSFSFRH